MSSKKHRKRIKALYQHEDARSRAAVPDVHVHYVPGEAEIDLKAAMERLESFYVEIPELDSPPLKLGVPLEGTFQIGDDPPQKDILFCATIVVSPGASAEALLEAMHGLKIRPKEVIQAAPVSANRLVQPTVKALYPFPFSGYFMYPLPVFGWYGREKVRITEVRQCPQYREIMDMPHVQTENIIVAGSLVGRQLDTVNVLL